MAALASKMAANMATGSSSSEPQLQQQPKMQQQPQNVNIMPAAIIQPDYLLNNDRGLFKVYCFIKDFIG